MPTLPSVKADTSADTNEPEQRRTPRYAPGPVSSGLEPAARRCPVLADSRSGVHFAWRFPAQWPHTGERTGVFAARGHLQMGTDYVARWSRAGCAEKALSGCVCGVLTGGATRGLWRCYGFSHFFAGRRRVEYKSCFSRWERVEWRVADGCGVIPAGTRRFPDARSVSRDVRFGGGGRLRPGARGGRWL
jgi:hypothetical protein